MTLRSEVAEALSLDTLRYSAVWEDHRLLQRALALTPEDDVLCICSAGDNALALLLEGPKSVTAIDMSPAQAAVMRLKMVAIERFDRSEDLAILFGFRPGDPLALYDGLRDHLPDEASVWLDAHRDDLAAGLVHRGRLEAYFARFRADHLELLWPADLRDRMLAADLPTQRHLFDVEADSPAFAAAFEAYFGRENMEAQGRDPAQFQHVTGGDPGRYFYDQACWAFRTFPLADNPYVEQFFFGTVTDLEAGPAWIRPSNFAALKSALPRLRLHTGELEQLLDASPVGTFSHGAFSDAFEYMSPELADAVFRRLADRFRAGRIAWWNLLVPRTAPDDVWKARPDVSEPLQALDRAWFYSAFHVADRR
jgi:S-adenosylmethionine-diacylglycerol 3-amino-3-carboxypropyl transferase